MDQSDLPSLMIEAWRISVPAESVFLPYARVGEYFSSEGLEFFLRIVGFEDRGNEVVIVCEAQR